jgi:hypothetical protein
MIAVRYTYATADIMADVALTDTDPLTVMLWPQAICTLLVRPGTMPPVQFLGSAQAPAIPPPEPCRVFWRRQLPSRYPGG